MPVAIPRALGDCHTSLAPQRRAERNRSEAAALSAEQSTGSQ